MNGNNKLGRGKFARLLTCFCLDVDATKTAVLAGVNRNTVNRRFMVFRQLIYEHQMNEMKNFLGEVEVDESFFGPARPDGALEIRPRHAEAAGVRHL